jgi:hypothetical protein
VEGQAQPRVPSSDGFSLLKVTGRLIGAQYLVPSVCAAAIRKKIKNEVAPAG